jgi:hypothetical protein
MKFYVYISDSKVDMLLSQISPGAKRTIATELKMDLKLLSASRKSEVETQADRLTRLDAVVVFIREFGNLGTIDEPDEYIEDRLAMRWGPYGMAPYKEELSPLVYFGGATGNTIVGLGGSAKHVLGNTGPSAAFSASATPYLLTYLEQHLDTNEILGSEASQSEDMSLSAVHLATMGMKGPRQNLEFMAKRLLHGPSPYPERDGKPNMSVLLATPLYVAYDEDPYEG